MTSSSSSFLTMADGPPANLPAGLEAYAGYVNDSGIGETWPAVVAIPAPHHLSITTNGSPAMCADVESGAMSDWTGYVYGYCEVSNVNALVAQYGRPAKLWTAHRGRGRHICSPLCWPGLVTTADGTQWSNHGGLWDESILAPDFFVTYPIPTKGKDDMASPTELSNGKLVTQWTGAGVSAGHMMLLFTNLDGTSPSIIDATLEIGDKNNGQPFLVE